MKERLEERIVLGGFSNWGWGTWRRSGILGVSKRLFGKLSREVRMSPLVAYTGIRSRKPTQLKNKNMVFIQNHHFLGEFPE
jgi:hypothetical protein